MAEEFADFIKDLNTKPLKEQVKELQGVVSNLVGLVEKFINNYTIELSVLNNKIISLEAKLISSKLPKIEVLATSPPPPPPDKRPIGNENVRGAIMGELKALFDKKK